MSVGFPADFVWGAATASYQIEGSLERGRQRREHLGSFFPHARQVSDGDTGDVADDHYHRWQEDVALMAELGVQAYRFSISWPRVLPKGYGRANPAGLDFYSRLVDALLAAGIQPLDHPLPLGPAPGPGRWWRVARRARQPKLLSSTRRPSYGGWVTG